VQGQASGGAGDAGDAARVECGNDPYNGTISTTCGYHLDYLAVGALTHSVRVLDIGLDMCVVGLT